MDISQDRLEPIFKMSIVEYYTCRGIYEDISFKNKKSYKEDEKLLYDYNSSIYLCDCSQHVS